ncbi:armadillo-type protein [Mycena latifolia]|nr:armadillo-type protein [Mycena latifolia]
MACHDSTGADVLGTNPCAGLIPLLRGENMDVIQDASQALYQIIRLPGGAQAAADASVIDSVAGMFQSSDALSWTHDMLQQLALQEPTAAMILRELVSLMRAGNLTVIEHATNVLSQIARFPSCAQATVDAKVLDCTSHLLASSSHGVRERTCELLGELATHRATAAAVLAVNPCLQLVRLLRDSSKSAAKALYWIALSPKGAQAVVDANMLDFVRELLDSPDKQICRRTCQILEHLVCHEDTAAAVFGQNPCPQIVYLLRRTAMTSASEFGDDDSCLVRASAISRQDQQIPGGCHGNCSDEHPRARFGPNGMH